MKSKKSNLALDRRAATAGVGGAAESGEARAANLSARPALVKCGSCGAMWRPAGGPRDAQCLDCHAIYPVVDWAPITQSTIVERRAELQREIKELETQFEAQRQARKDAVKRNWKFTLLPAHPARQSFIEIWDPAVRLLILAGEVTNKQECIDAGHSDDYVKGGAMAYYYNDATKKIIGSTGGGTVFLTLGRWTQSPEKIEEGQQALDLLNEFMAHMPEGGDVTGIIKTQTKMSWLA